MWSQYCTTNLGRVNDDKHLLRWRTATGETVVSGFCRIQWICPKYDRISFPSFPYLSLFVVDWEY
jgi:hypothetical protein